MEIDNYSKVQSIAKQVLDDLKFEINAKSTEASIATKAAELLAEYGVKDTWYHNVPAFVLLGERSCLSISGRDYTPAQAEVGSTNLVTIDLSPKVDGIWGDCARSFIIEEGKVVKHPSDHEFQEGLKVEAQLHEAMKSFVTPNTKFSELFEFGNNLIFSLGYENLDFLNNLGHSIELNPDNRRFIDSNCHDQLGSVGLFTYEPHICKNGGIWGFKHENIYYFDEGSRINEL